MIKLFNDTGAWMFHCDNAGCANTGFAAGCKNQAEAEDRCANSGWHVGVSGLHFCPDHLDDAAKPNRVDIPMESLTVEMVEAEVYAIITQEHRLFELSFGDIKRVDALRLAGKIAQRLHAASIPGSGARSNNDDKRTQLQVITAMKKED